MISFLNSTAEFWFQYFGLKVIQDSIFLIFIFIALSALKNTSAQAKYMLSLIGLLKLLLPPFLPFQIGATAFAPLVMDPGNTASPAASASSAAVPMVIHLSPVAILFTIWLAVMLLYLTVFIIINVIQKGHLQSAQHIAAHSLPHNITLKQMENLATPQSFLFSKQIVLPSYWNKLPEDCQHVMLQHEVAHIKRRDGFVQIVQTIAQAIFFFHPLVWLLNERINEYREMACDDTAIATSQLSPLAYSRYLVHIAEKMVQPVWPFSSASALIKQKNKLLNRVNYQMKESNMKRKSIVIITILLLVMMAPLSWYCSKDKGLSLDDEEPASTSNVQQFVAYDEPPIPQGGFAAIQRNLNYPERARQTGMQGRVYLNVLIDSTGQVLETRTLRTPGTERDIEAHPRENREIEIPYIDEEAVQEMVQAAKDAIRATQWTPAKQRDRALSVWVGIPVVFKLSDNEGNAQMPSNFEGTPGPEGGLAQLYATFGNPNEIMQKYKDFRPSKESPARPFTFATIYCHIDENGNCFEAEVREQDNESIACGENIIPALKDMKWNVVKKNGEPIKYWHTIQHLCENAN